MNTNTLSSTKTPASGRQMARRTSRWVALMALMLAGPAAFAQLAGTYTINRNAATGGTNFASFTEAATALNTSGISASVRFNVLNGPYNEQFSLGQVAGVSATDTIVVDGGASKQTLTYTGVVAQPAAVLLNGTDRITLQNLTIDASAGATYGIGVLLVGQADNNRVANCVVMGPAAATSTTADAAIAASGGVTSGTSAGNANNLRIENNVLSGGYYGVILTGTSATARATGLRVTGNEIRDFYGYGLDVENHSGARLLNNNIHRTNRTGVTAFYGVYLNGCAGTAVERNRIHDSFTGNPASTSAAYGIYFTASDGTAGTENDAVNNLVYNFNGAGTEYGVYNSSSDFARYYYNTISLDSQAGTGATQTTYGIYQTTLATGIDIRNNVVSVTRTGGTGEKKALGFNTTTSTISSNYNDLYIGTGATYFTGAYGTADFVTLANWRTANGGIYDANSVQVNPEFVGATLVPSASPLNGTATPLARVPRDFTNALRSTTAPDMGAYEFTPASNDVAVESIDSPAAPVATGARTVTVTIRNNGLVPLNTVVLTYTLNGGTPVAQTFTLTPGLAAGATRAVSFTTQGTVVTGLNTLSVTASLPNGSTDSNPGNNTQTSSFYPALAGTYTINKNVATGGTNFASFTEAATVLNGGGISASVRFNVLNGPYAEQFVLDQVAGVSATDTIVVDGGASKQTLSYTGTVTQPGAVVLNGTDRVTLQNLTIDASAGATYGVGVLLVGQANNNRVANCVVMGPTAATSSVANAAIAASGGVTSASSAGDANNLRIENNVLSGGYYGVVLTGASATARNSGIRVMGNEIRDFYLYGLDVENQSGAQLINNNIHRTTRPGLSTFYGVYLVGVAGTAVERNRIHDSFTGNTASTSAAYGLYISADGTAGAENDMVNNLVYNFNGSGTEYGIYNVGSDYARYYYNTVSLDNQAATGATQLTYGFYQTTLATGIDFRNNVVSVTRTGGTGSKYALYFNTITSSITSNYNDLYVSTGALYFTGRYTTDFVTLADWKAANGSAFDQNSVQADPQFLNLAAGNLQPTASSLNGAATPLARVPRDFTNALRSTTAPDLGAYEFTPATNDVAVETITSPVAPATPGPRTVTVTIRNNGQVALSTVRLEYSLNGGTAVTQTFTLSPAIAAGATGTVSFTTPVTLVSGANQLAVTASLPNGTTDANPNNNTQTVTLYTALAGTYTINKNAATGGTNFASFTEAAAALNGAGIAASVRFNVLNGPYTEQFSLGQVAGVSATDTIVVDGGASKQTLRYTGVVAQPAAVLLNGTDRLTLQNLTIDASAGATYGIGVHLVGQANNNRVASCVVMGPAAATSSTANAAIAASGSVTSATTVGDANSLRVENSVLSGGYYCLTVTGASTTARNTGLRVTGNEVRDFYFYGIDVENQSGAQVIGNDVHRTTRAVVSTFYGVYLNGCAGTAVERNRIHDPYTGDPTDTGIAYGLYFTASDGAAGTENDAVNNLIYNFTGSGTQYGIYNASSDFARYYHNTISLDNASGGATQTTYGFYQTTVATGIDFRNNIVSVTRTGGSGSKYALYFVTTTSAITSNYNDLYVGTAGTYFTGRYGTANFATLADWRTANGNAYDQNSVAAEPRFVNVAQGNYRPTTAPLDGAGTPLARVPRDFAGVLRNSPPDLGAYEFAPITDDVALVSIDSPNTTATPGVNPLRVTIRNNGATTLTSVVLTYTLNTGTPVAQTFAGLTLAPNATQQLSFTPGLSVPQQGTNTLTVSASLPNGNPDGNTTNNTLTITFDQPTPPNDEPCGAVALTNGTTTSSSNAGASTSVQSGINFPNCGGGQLPRDVWFTFAPAAASMTLTLTGAPAGTVRVYSSPSCSAGPFNLVQCAGSGANSTSVGAVAVTGLTPGQTYYIAVSNFGSSDPGGSFTITPTVLSGTRSANSTALAVYPNPSATGQLTLRLATGTAGTGSVELLNALGQVVKRQPLAGTGEQQVSTLGLAAGLYTLRVQAGAEVLTRKVVLQ
ncbi:right-handed parallel beta-helix repeat-containing protein [Hymenobacter sp. M29]|uniref:Right-handed parallel beta-helix repeat-containing protein n=1 Tax=Hymenobacter mellowenesis TaxID=3063995 RepID=A0ABT9AIC4_9BACT|nr:CARDB domain-containing protein [Hymenobacter sp. M29]MDO7849318.1 right-handed parallel beta-helix repeat-containing protein [Hymenobacter sp. M29]